jgi:hypothetical protein
LKLALAAAVLLNVVLVIIWTGLITYLSSMAHAGVFHCGTLYVSIHVAMQIVSLVSGLVLLWGFSFFRSSPVAMTQTARFIRRLPLCVLVGLNLAYWSTKPFMYGF